MGLNNGVHLKEISLAGRQVSPFGTNDMFPQASGYEISPFGRNDTANAGSVGGRVGRFAPDPSSQISA